MHALPLEQGNNEGILWEIELRKRILDNGKHKNSGINDSEATARHWTENLT